jgi:hypothetical protein
MSQRDAYIVQADGCRDEQMESVGKAMALAVQRLTQGYKTRVLRVTYEGKRIAIWEDEPDDAE